MPPELEYFILLLLRQQQLRAVHQELRRVLSEVNDCPSVMWLQRRGQEWLRVKLYLQMDTPVMSLLWGRYDSLIHQATSTHYRLVTTNMRYCYPNSYYTRQAVKLRYDHEKCSVAKFPTSTDSMYYKMPNTLYFYS